MLKKLVFILFMFNVLVGDTYAEKHLIYVNSSGVERLSDLIDNVVDLSNRLRGDVYVYISNGPSPVLVTNKTDVSSNLKRLLNDLNPSIPDPYEDCDLLNRFLIEQKFFTSAGSTESINFYYFLSSKHSELYRFPEKIVDRTMLLNNIKTNEGLKVNISVNIYFNKTQESTEYISSIKKNEDYYVYKY
jgi:hypothetical protein